MRRVLVAEPQEARLERRRSSAQRRGYRPGTRSRMTSLVGLGPLLDGDAIFRIARQILSARRRLALRTGGSVPTAGELAVALRMFIIDADRRRAQNSQNGQSRDENSSEDPGLSENQTQTVSQPESGDVTVAAAETVNLETNSLIDCDLYELREFLKLADLTYAASVTWLEETTMTMNYQILDTRWVAEKWAPSYFLAYSKEKSILALCIRGSKETSDFITNLTCETETFLSGFGHLGIVKSAVNLYTTLRRVISEYTDVLKPTRFIITGHSLGGAVASALTMLFREGEPNAKTRHGRSVLSNTICYSYCPPPFLSHDLARASSECGITTIVTGLDLIPRLSAASLDRLLLAVSRFDWTADFVRGVHRSVSTATSAFLGTDSAERVASFLTNRGGEGVAWAVNAIGESAQNALAARRTQAQRSIVWDGILAAGVVASSVLSNQFFNSSRNPATLSNGRVRTPEYTFARQFGLTDEDVERLLVHEEAPPEVYIAGRILHFDQPFVPPESYSAPQEFPPVSIRERQATEFLDVEASAWMLHDHNPAFLFYHLDKIL